MKIHLTWLRHKCSQIHIKGLVLLAVFPTQKQQQATEQNAPWPQVNLFFFLYIFFIQSSYIMSLTLMLFLLFCFPLYPLWHVKALSWYDATILKEHIMDLWQRSMHPCSTQTVTANSNNLVLLQTAVGHNVARLVNGTVSSTEVFQIMCTSILTSSRLVI